MSGPTHRKHHVIHTRRLVIRSAIPEDAQAIAALRGNPDNDFFGEADSDDPSTYLRRMIRWQKASEEGRYAFMAILLRPLSESSTPAENSQAEGEFIGFGGYNEFRWLQSPDGRANSVLEVDVGTQIDHKHWRKGYGREAFVGLCEYAFTDLGAQQLSCDTDLRNTPWRELMKTVGLGEKEQAYVNLEEDLACDEESWLWRFTREDWKTAKTGWRSQDLA